MKRSDISICSYKSTFPNIPCPINGMALANVGLGIMILRLSVKYKFNDSMGLWIVVGFFTILSIIMILIYTLRIFYAPLSWIKQDFSPPGKLSNIGAFAMSICLVAVVSKAANFPFTLTLIISLVGSFIQAASMCRFFYQAYTLRPPMEPFFNAAIHSCLFPVIAIPGDDLPLVVIRYFFLLFGLITLLPSTCWQAWRVLKPPAPGSTWVANNPSVCIMQSASSICLTAWIYVPVTSTSTDGIGLVITHILFAIVTIFYVLQWISVIQRRHMFLSLGDDPGWTGATFPFANTAITTNVYQLTLGHTFHPIAQTVLSIWVLLLTAFATFIILYVNLIYLRNFWFLFEKKIDTHTHISDAILTTPNLEIDSEETEKALGNYDDIITVTIE